MRPVAHHDLQRRRSTSAAPVQSEVLALLAALDAEGVPAPAEAVRAMQLLAGTTELHTPPDVPGWIAGADLDSLTPGQIMEHLRGDLADLGLSIGKSGPNLFGQVHNALVARAAQAITTDLDRILDELRPTWDAAADLVHDAARTGITSATTAEAVIAMGDEAVAAYRQLAAPLATLDRLHQLRNTLLFYAGRELAEHELGPQRWLDRASSTPPALTTTKVTWQQRAVERLAGAPAEAIPAGDTDTVGPKHETEIDTEHREEIPA
jgi:hypothetical protein